MTMAAARHPRRHDDRPGLGEGVPGGDQDSEQHAADAAQRGQQQRLGQELGADLPLVVPSDRRRPISARRSSTEITIVFATPTPPASRATPPADQQPGEGLVAGLLRQRVGRPGHLDLGGRLRVRGGRRHRPDVVDARLVGPGVDGRRVAVEPQVVTVVPAAPER
jgi:hypothetical protein